MFRSLVLGTALAIVASPALAAQTTYVKKNHDTMITGPAIPVPAENRASAPVLLAQSGDATYRVNELEQEVRRLTGKVEELTFQLLQLQENMRKMQEDNESRFQDLEDKRTDASDQLTKTDPEAVASVDSKIDGVGEEASLGKPEASEVPAPDVDTAPPLAAKPLPPIAKDTGPLTAPGPRVLGTLTFDANGNVVDSRESKASEGEKLASLPLPGVFSDGVDGGREAAEYGPTPDAVFQVGKAAVENKRYKRAEGAFRAYLKAWPKDPREGEARYYLAEALFWQKDYYNAANIYLETHNAHPKAATAPDNLLGLGLSLAGLNQREVACATYSEVLKQYPQAGARLGPRLEAEQFSAKCQ